MSDRSMALCERIRQHCRERNWYGPDSLSSTYEMCCYYDANGEWHEGEIPASGHYDFHGTWHPQHERIFHYRYVLDADGKIQDRPIMHDARVGFEFPPATEAQVRATEAALGLPLLPLLQALFTQVANGGFGPAEGITGIQGGYACGEDGHYWTMDMDNDTNPSMEYVDLATQGNHLISPFGYELPPNARPAHLLHFCYWGCGEDVYVDGKSGHVFLAGAGRAVPGGFTQCFGRIDDSLENWLERWLRGERDLWHA